MEAIIIFINDMPLETRYRNGVIQIVTDIYEEAEYAKGISILAGMDEVGRGPLAGPVVACALILPRGIKIEGVDDSKKLSEKKREKLYAVIKEQALAVGIGCVSQNTIDEINILRATELAMAQALNNLEIKPQHVLIDGNFVKGINIPQTPIIKGDGKSISIAAASIIAKVTRDRMMCGYHELYPQYGFAANKGYGTKAHIAAIREHGITGVHRKSFTKNFAEPVVSDCSLSQPE